jgi:hypothetical protein
MHRSRLVAECRIDQAHIVALEVGPVALRFEAEHPAAGLPAITDLTAGGAAGCVMATLGPAEHRIDEVPALPARSPTTVGADVEAAPVVDDGDRRRRGLGVRTRGEVGGRRGSGERDEGNCTQQNLLHGSISSFAASVGPEAFLK